MVSEFISSLLVFAFLTAAFVYLLVDYVFISTNLPKSQSNRYSLDRVLALVRAVKTYRRSMPMIVLVTAFGACLAIVSRLVSRHVMGFEDKAFVAGMVIIYNLCSSFPQFSGNQEGYTVRQSYIQALSALEQAKTFAKIGNHSADLWGAIDARQRLARGDMVELRDTRTNKVIGTAPYEYNGFFDRRLQQTARTDVNAAGALQQLALFDALCKAAAPDTLIQPIFIMYLLTFGVVLPLTLMPAMDWWYLLFSFPPTFVCIGGYNALCEANYFLSPHIPEYVKAINQICDQLKEKDS